MINPIRNIFYMLFLLLSFASAQVKTKFELNISSSRLYLGEPTIATFTLIYPSKLKVDSIHSNPSSLNNFDIEELNKTKVKKIGDIIKKRYYFLLTPLKIGTLKITPQTIELSYQNLKNYRYITHHFNTKVKSIIVREVPNMLKVVGDYKIELKSDKNSTKANEPIHLVLKIVGKGNSRYIPPFKLKIPKAIVYASKANFHNYYTKDGYISEFIQRFTIISEQDYTIAPIRFRYFNIKTELPEILETPKIDIKVDNPKITRDNWIHFGFFIFGFFTGSVMLFIILFFYKRREIDTPLIQQIKSAKSDKELYRVLLPLSNNYHIRQIVQELENNIYKNSQKSINIKDIIKNIRNIEKE